VPFTRAVTRWLAARALTQQAKSEMIQKFFVRFDGVRGPSAAAAPIRALHFFALIDPRYGSSGTFGSVFGLPKRAIASELTSHIFAVLSFEAVTIRWSSRVKAAKPNVCV
jgi:hypothetical protein